MLQWILALQIWELDTAKQKAKLVRQQKQWQRAN
jgi:hypothetical protein